MFRSIPVVRSMVFAGVLPLLSVAAVQAQLSSHAQDAAIRLGEQAPSTPVAATVWLTLPKQAALDAAVKAMYTKGSPVYHQFASVADLDKFAPTAAQIAAVKKVLAAHNLTILSTDAHSLSIHVTGQTSDFEAALHTPIEQYQTAQGKTVVALASKPELGGEAVGMVRAVTGINQNVMEPFNVVPVNPATGKQMGLVPVSAAANPEGALFSPNCLYAPQAVTLTTPGAYLPDAIYYGIQYGAPPTNTTPGTISPCGYSPSDFAKLSGVKTAHTNGFRGKGQTIAIIDAYGSPTLQADVAAFDTLYKLPAAKLKLLQSAPVTKTNSGWAGETTLDVEWAHAVAPEAKIVQVSAPTAYTADLQNALLEIIENHLATIVSNSYGLGENESSLQDLTSWDELCEFAAFEGIDVNFGSGDSGDYYAAEKLGVTDVSSPADSPYATAVGGTSLAYAPGTKTAVETGWGTNATELATPAGPDAPPNPLGFIYGAGGGISQVFAKPAYQSALTGSGRELPDISAIADPYTGVEILITLTVDGQTNQYFELIGGTSLATPVFSGEYALIQQAAGQDLGQAAPLLAENAGTQYITDIMAPPTQASAFGAVLTAKGVTTYSAAQLVQPETTSGFLGTIYNAGAGSYYDLSFATDSSLPVTPGWDPVTGWGVLNMKAIFKAAAQ